MGEIESNVGDELGGGGQSRRIHDEYKRQSLWKEVGDGIRETFFSDQPLRSFEGQSKGKKFLLGLQAVFPILKWGTSYNLSKLKGDLVAGFTITSMQIPQDIAYAKLAGLAPQYGLYSSFVPPLVYASIGSSRELAIGPVAVVSLLLFTLLQKEYDPVKQVNDYRRLAFTATFFAGVIQAALGILRLGFMVDFLSHAVTVGFMSGAAVVIGLQQLKGLLGIKKFTKQTDIVSVMHSVWSNAHHGWDWRTIIIGVAFLAFLLTTKYVGKKKKSLFWVPAIAPLISVIISTFFVFITRADKHGVQIVQDIHKGINPPSIHELFLVGENVAKGLRIGAVVGLVALTEALAIGRTFADIRGYELDGNKEMIALGTANIVGSLTSCFVVTGGFARSAVNYMAGCQTPASNIVLACIVVLTLEVITPLFKYIPNAVLASIIISAVSGLFDVKAMLQIWKIDKFDFLACMGAFFGVIFHSVCLSVARIIFRATRPQAVIIGNIPNTTEYRSMQQYSDATAIPGILIVRVDCAIYFSNANYIKEWIGRQIQDNKHEKNHPRIQYLIIDMSAVTDIDTSGILALDKLYNNMQKKNVQLILANVGQFVMDKLHASNLINLIGQDKIFRTVANAVQTYIAKMEQP